MLKYFTVTMAATAVLANPDMAVPDEKVAASICSASPFKQWLPLSKLPAANTYCHKEFPIATPTCLTTTTPKATTKRVTVTQTNTQYDVSRITKTTGTPHYFTTTRTLTPSPATIATTITETAAPVYVTECSTATSSRVTSSSTSVSYTSTISAAGNSTQTAGPAYASTNANSTTSYAASNTTTSMGSSFTGLNLTLVHALDRREGAAKITSKKAMVVAKKAATTLGTKERSSLLSRLRTMEGLKKAQQSTICHCIETTPACTHKTVTAQRKSSTTTVYNTVSVDLHPKTTIYVSNTGYTVISTTITLAPAVSTTYTTSTPTAYVSCDTTKSAA